MVAVEGQGITNVTRIHPLEKLYVCIQFTRV